MVSSNTLRNIEKIESMFPDNVDSLINTNLKEEKKIISKVTYKKLKLIPSFLIKRLYRALPGILKDIIFWSSVTHKSPSSKFFAKTKYDELRTLLDIKVSSMTILDVPKDLKEGVHNTFRSGFYTSNLSNLTHLDTLFGDVLTYSKSSHAGARPYFKDGKNEKIEGSFSSYYSFSDAHSKEINRILNMSLGRDFRHHLSALAGYKCELEDISFSLAIVYGENSNSEMHQDTFSGIAKGFIYLQDITEKDAPFEYLEGTYNDAAFRSSRTNNAVIHDDIYSSGSTRLRGKDLEDAMKQYPLKTFTGKKGLFVLANTSGYHRKGPHISSKPRITLNFEIRRIGLVGKFLINSFAFFKYKLQDLYISS